MKPEEEAKKLRSLTNEELALISGGNIFETGTYLINDNCVRCGECQNVCPGSDSRRAHPVH